jgi:hypothetical protein
MAGSVKKIWKKKGRMSARKQYQVYCREQYAKGLVPDGNGGWMAVSNLRDSGIRTGFEKMISRL